MSFSTRVQLVEDTACKQKVMVRMPQKSGHAVDVAALGATSLIARAGKLDSCPPDRQLLPDAAFHDPELRTILQDTHVD